MRSFTHNPLPLFFLLAVGLLFGCSPEHYRKKADHEVYGIIKSKSRRVPGMDKDFSIDRPSIDPLKDAKPAPEASIIPEEKEKETTADPLLINMEKALWIASINSRDYQSRREDVYLSALDLTLQRNAFRPLFFGAVTGRFDHNADDEETVSGGSAFGFDWLLATGATLSAELATDLSEFLTGNPRKAAGSLFSLTLAQPLLRGRTISATEPLTQAEQNVYYEIRDFVRYQRTFFVSVYSEYYRVLQARQILRNELLNYENLVKARKRAEAMAEAGRLPEFQVDQTLQNELSARDRFERAQQRYHEALDSFKITLALPTETNISLDLRELEELQEARPASLQYSRSHACNVALDQRLDLQTTEEKVEDAHRKIKVAIDDLRPGLDVVVEADTDTENNKPLKFSGNNNAYSVALELDLALDRKAERNTFRRRLIEAKATRRDFEKLRNEVVHEVRNRWRDYLRAHRTYQIQRHSVELAQNRVDSTNMLLQAGRANTRDMLEAREALLSAQNSLVQAVVDYKVARLELARDMDILTVHKTGQMETNFNEFAPE